MKPKFTPKISYTPQRVKSRRPNTKAEAKVAWSASKKRAKELEAAVQWCLENNASGYLALKSGLFPSIKHCNTIDRRLKGDIVAGKEK